MSERSIHRIVRINYWPRVVGFLYMMWLIVSIFYAQDRSVYFWAAAICQGLLWPQLAARLSRVRRDSKTAEMQNMLADSFFVGIWISLWSFSLWPTLAAFCGISIDNVATKGWSFLSKGLAAMFLGVVFAGMIFGFQFNPDSNVLTSFLSIAIIITFTGIIGLTAYFSSQRAVKKSNDVAEKNRQIQALANSLEQKVEERTLQLKRKINELEMLTKVGASLISTLDLKSRLQVIIDSAIAVIPAAQKGSILLLDNTRTLLEIKAAYGYDMQLVKNFQLKVGEGYGGRAIAENKSFIVNQVDENLSLGGLDFVPPIKSVMVAVLQKYDKAIGVISLDNFSAEAAFTEDDLKLLTSFAAHAAMAVEEAKLYEDLEAYKNELEKRVEQRTLELREAQTQLIHSEKMASLGQLTAGVAHEINNPITFIYSNLPHLEAYVAELKNLLSEAERLFTPEQVDQFSKLKSAKEYEFLNQDVDALLKSYRTGSERITDIVQDLRTFSRLDEDTLKLADIHEGIDSTLALIHKQYHRRIEIIREFGSLPMIECYPGHLNQVFMNILVNSIQAIEDQGRIWITTESQNGEVRINIRDNGIGIPEHIRNKIFEPFFTTKPIGVGTGLGLSISFGIVQRHGGRIEVESEVGKGTAFIVTLPVKQRKVLRNPL